MTLQPYILVSALSPLLAIVIGIVYKKKSLLWYYAIADFGFDAGIILLKRVWKTNYSLAGNLFFLLEFLFFAFAFRKRIFRNDKEFGIIISVLMLGYLYYTVICHSPFEHHLTGAAIFFSAPYILWCILGFHSIMFQKNNRIIALEKSSFFWFNTALILYACGSIILFLFYDYLIALKGNKEFLSLWLIVFISVNILKNIVLVPIVYFYKKEEYECS